MIFHDNPLLADNSHEISFLIFFENLSSAAVVIGTLGVNQICYIIVIVFPDKLLIYKI